MVRGCETGMSHLIEVKESTICLNSRQETLERADVRTFDNVGHRRV